MGWEGVSDHCCYKRKTPRPVAGRARGGRGCARRAVVGGASQVVSLESSPQSPRASPAVIVFQTRQHVPVQKPMTMVSPW